MTLFALTQASSRGAGQRQVETKFRLSKAKGRTVTAMVMIGNNGRCHVELRAHSREFMGRYSATVEIEFINAAGQGIHVIQTPPVTSTSIFGIRFRGKLSHEFTLDPEIIKKTEKIRITSGKESWDKASVEDPADKGLESE
jgi:hypothetical protein